MNSIAASQHRSIAASQVSTRAKCGARVSRADGTMRVTKVEEPDAGGQASLEASPGQGRPRHTGRLWLVGDQTGFGRFHVGDELYAELLEFAYNGSAETSNGDLTGDGHSGSRGF